MHVEGELSKDNLKGGEHPHHIHLRGGFLSSLGSVRIIYGDEKEGAPSPHTFARGLSHHV